MCYSDLINALVTCFSPSVIQIYTGAKKALLQSLSIFDKTFQK